MQAQTDFNSCPGIMTKLKYNNLKDISSLIHTEAIKDSDQIAETRRGTWIVLVGHYLTIWHVAR